MDRRRRRAANDVYSSDLVEISEARFAMRHLGAGAPPVQRTLTALEVFISERRVMESMHATHCVAAGKLARHLGLREAVRDALQVFARWEGKGAPGLLAGSAVNRPERLVLSRDL